MPSIATRSLEWLAKIVSQHPRAVVLSQIILCFASVFYTIGRIEFHTDRNALVDSDQPYHRNFLDYKANFDSQDDLITVVESEDHEKNRQFVERLGARLKAQKELFTGVFFKGELQMLGSKALLFLEDSSVMKTMVEHIRQARPMIEIFENVNSLQSLFKELNRRFRDASEKPEAGWLDALPALRRVMNQATDSLLRKGPPPSPGAETLFAAGLKAQNQKYISFADGHIYLMIARPIHASLQHEAVDRLRELVAIVRSEVPGINVGITGETVLAIDEMHQSQIDTFKASCLSLILVTLIFIFCYQETKRPLKATLCLLIGLGYTMGYTTLVVGHLNILTIAFFPMLIGLAIDFGVHLITRYEEELRRNISEKEAIRIALIHTGQGIFTGCLTTAGAFYAMAWTDFRGVQEMGIITGGGMLLTLIPMMTILPVLLLNEQKQSKKEAFSKSCPRANLEQLWLNRPRIVLGIGLGLSVLAFTQIGKVRFDYNLLNMQSKSLPAVVYEKKLIREAEKSVIYAIVIADSLEAIARLETQIEKLSSVASVDSMSRFLDTKQSHRREKIEAMKQSLASIQFAEPSRESIDLNDLSQSLTFFQSYLSLAAKAVAKADPNSPAIHQFKSLKHAAGQLQMAMRKSPPAVAKAQLFAFQNAFFTDIRDTFQALANQDTQTPMNLSELPETLARRFVGHSGQHLLQVYPKENVWERKHQERFVRQLRDVTDRFDNSAVVTGTPVQLLEYTSLLKQSYEAAALYALGAIVLLVWFHFRSFSAVLLALLPLALGGIWLLGFMGIANIPFNPANIMTLPLVVGIGVSGGIHILNRYREEKNPKLLSKSTGKGVLVSGLTTMAGFGSLCLAAHQGIQSLGQVMTLGVLSTLIAALTLLPCLLQLLSSKTKGCQNISQN